MSDLPDPLLHRRPKPRVAVLFGGRSSEHAISCVTAGSVLQAIDRERYDVVPIGIAKDGRWVLESGDTARLAIGGPDQLPEVDASLPVLSIAQDGGAGLDGRPRQRRRPAARSATSTSCSRSCTGRSARTARSRGCSRSPTSATSGPGVLASAVGMDKHYMKVVFEAAGLPMLPYAVVTDRRLAHRPRARAATEVDALGYPVFVKPCRGGSSIGISKVRRPRRARRRPSRRPGAGTPRSSSRRPPATGAREIECGVLEGLDDGPPEASVVAEITVEGDHDFYDFAAKYLPEEHTRSTSPPTSRTRSPTRCARWRPRPSRRCPARGWPGSTSSCSPTAGWCSTRSTRCRASPRRRCSRGCGRPPGCAYPDARRPAAPARAAAAHRPALTARAVRGSAGAVDVLRHDRRRGRRAWSPAASSRRAAAP